MPETKLHLITELEGIGEATARRLESFGIRYAEDLLASSLTDLLALLADVPRMTGYEINRQVAQAKLLRVPGISAQTAEGLTNLQIASLEAFVGASSTAITNGLLLERDAGRIPATLTATEVASAQLAAAKMINRGSVLLRVMNEEGGPLVGARVRTHGKGDGIRQEVSTETISGGMALQESLVAGSHLLFVSLDGYIDATVVAQAYSDRWSLHSVTLKEGTSTPVVIDEFSGGLVPAIPPTAVVKNRRWDFEDLTVLPPVVVLDERDGKGIRVASVWRRSIDQVVEVPYFIVPESSLSANPERGAILAPNASGIYEDVDQTYEEVRAALEKERRA